jgi:hypothetical protein
MQACNIDQPNYSLETTSVRRGLKEVDRLHEGIMPEINIVTGAGVCIATSKELAALKMRQVAVAVSQLCAQVDQLSLAPQGR